MSEARHSHFFGWFEGHGVVSLPLRPLRGSMLLSEGGGTGGAEDQECDNKLHGLAIAKSEARRKLRQQPTPRSLYFCCSADVV